MDRYPDRRSESPRKYQGRLVPLAARRIHHTTPVRDGLSPDPTPIPLRACNGGTTRPPPGCRLRPATQRRGDDRGILRATPSTTQSKSGGAHEGRCRQGDRARRAARRPGTRSARQAQGGRAGDPRRTRRRRRFVHPRRRLRGGRRHDRVDRRALRRAPTSSCAWPSRPRRRSRDCAAARPSSGSWRRSSTRALAGTLAKAGRHRDQPRRHPADAVASPDDGRAVIAGERRWLQGGPHRRERLRTVLPAADDRRRHGQAGQRPDPRDRRRRACRPSARPSASARSSRPTTSGRRPASRPSRSGPSS